MYSAPTAPSTVTRDSASARSRKDDGPTYTVAAFHLRYLQQADGDEAAADLTPDELSGYSDYLTALWGLRPSDRTPDETAEVNLAKSIQDEYERSKVLGQLDNGNFSDTTNAGYLESKMVPDWVWSFPRGQWLHWTGHRFQPDTHNRVMNDALLHMRARTVRYASLQTDTRARDLANAVGAENLQRVRAALELLKTFPSINARGDELDQNPMLLGVSNGVLDFEAECFRAGHQSDLITRSTGIAFDASAACPRFLKFLREVFQEDDELIGWFQRVVGYTLTGSTREQALFLLYGTGANGKSVLMRVLTLILGDYAVNLPMSALEKETNPGPNRATPDLMILRGARLATASEVSGSARLNENRVKALTGGDEVTGRDLNKSNETFKPEAKIFLSANKPPEINDDSDGMWRRVRMIPFGQKFTYDGSEEAGNLRDDNLEATLTRELPGILTWAVRGTYAWLAQGLSDIPAVVLAATSAYQADSDHYGTFIDESCVLGKDLHINGAALYDAYKTHCEESGMRRTDIRSSTAFGRDMATRPGLTKKKFNNRIRYEGIGLAIEPQQAALGIGAVADNRGPAWTN